MKGNVRAMMFAATVMMVLALSAAWTVAVRADDGAPPPDVPTETAPTDQPAATDEGAVTEPAPVVEAAPTDALTSETAPVAEASQTEVAPTEEAAPTEAPVAEASATEIAPLEEAAASDAPVADSTTVLEQLPEGTDLVLLDGNGATVPLATTEASEIISGGDPMWCPAGVAPGAKSCSDPFPNLSSLVAGFTPWGTDGVIWIQGGEATTRDDVIIWGGGSWSAASDYSLTLNGGWLGCTPTCVSTIDPSNPSVIYGSLLISEWNGDVTLNNIVVANATLYDAALEVDTTKKVRLNQVTVRDSHILGALIVSRGDVAITDSAFSNNPGGDGLEVFTYGNIKLTDVEATANNGDGAYLDNCLSSHSWSCDGLRTTAVTLNGTNTFSFNTGDGLVVRGTGVITTNNLKADYNRGWGAYLDNYGNTSGAALNLNGINEFNYNGATSGDGPGLQIHSRGAITTRNITAIGNYGTGAYISNVYGGTRAVSLLGTNMFYGNGGYGVDLTSTGPINVSNLTASNNGGTGAYLDNSSWDYSVPVTLTGYGIFNENGYDGIDVISKGAIVLANVTANGNGTSGFVPTASGYWGNGAWLDNDSDPARLPNVALTGVNTFNDNWTYGLEIYSYGNILTNNVTANNNGQGGFDGLDDGAYLNNCLHGGDPTCSATTPKTITMAGINMLDGNHGYGLEAVSMGAITVSKIEASANGYGGAYLDNWWGQQIPAALSIAGYGSFNDNAGNMGLEAYSLGNITIANLTAMGNLGAAPLCGGDAVGGAYLEASKPSGNSNVVLTGAINVQSNGDWVNFEGIGLEISADGSITLANLHADNNAGSGAHLASGGNTSLSGINTADSNGLDGLWIQAGGQITLKNMTANWNGQSSSTGYGAWLDNSGATMAKNVTLIGLNSFNGNWEGGLEIDSTGIVLLNGLGADDNGWGVDVDNTYLAATSTSPAVTIVGTSHYNSNQYDGLKIGSFGTISLGYVTANDNGASLTSGSGVILDNSGAFVPKTITLTGTNAFNGNWDAGLDISSKGKVTLSNLSGDDNGYGAYLDNTYAGPTLLPQDVVITGTNHFNGNYENGLEVYSFGNITISNLSANSNGNNTTFVGSGAVLDNCLFSVGSCTALLPKNITITGFNTFVQNYENGLQFDTNGAFSIQRITANESGNDPLATGGPYAGLWGYAVGNISVLCGSMNSNGNATWGGYGYDLTSGGTLTLQGVTTYDNLTGNLSSYTDLNVVRTCTLP